MNLLSPAQGWLAIALFAAVFITITISASRNTDTTTKTGYMLAGRTSNWKKTGFSIAATWIWAPALFVAAQQGYEHGWVGVFWFTVPNVLCLIIFAPFAKRAREMFPDGFTISGVARQRYSPRVQKAYLVAFIGLAIASFAVQLLAGAVVITTLTGINFTLVTIALSTVALAYMVSTGLAGSIMSDWLQMLIIATVGFGLALAVTLTAGPDTITAGLNGIDGTYTSLTTGTGAALFWSFGLSTSIGLISGPFGDQSFWQRAWAVEKEHVTRSFYLGAAVFAVVPLVMSTLGFAAAGANLTIDDRQLTNLAAILHWLPDWTVFLFLLYIFAGLVSTMSSQMSSVASFAGHDFTPGGTNREAVRKGQAAMVALTIAAIALANTPGLTVTKLFIFYGTLRACTLVPTIFMLSHRPLNEKYTFYGIVGSILVAVPLSAIGNLGGVTPLVATASLAAIGVSGTATWAGSRLEQRRGAKRQ